MKRRRKNTPLMAALGLVLLVLTIPLTIGILQQQQDTQSKAQQTTVLSFLPDSSLSYPLQFTLGQTNQLQVRLDPGTNLVSFLRLEVLYDATKLAPVDPALSINTTGFSQVIEGPIYTSGRIAVSLSVGPDLTKAISTPVQVGTLTFKAIGTTSRKSNTFVTIGSAAQALSVSVEDGRDENVIANTKPATIKINSSGGSSGKGSGKKR